MSRISCLFQLSADEEKDIQARFFSVEPMMCVCQYFGLILKPDGHVEPLGQPHDQAENWKPFRAEDWTGVVKLYKSDSHIVGLKQDGTVVACGQNDKNQCETGDWRNIREVYVSEEATAGINQNGAAYNTYTFQKAVPTVQPAPAATTPQANTSAAPPSVETTDEKLFKYEVNPDGTVTITGYTEKEKNVVIPSTIAGRYVTKIGNRAFLWCKNLTSVTIPNGVTGIGENAFNGCKNLTSINLPDSITSIEKWAFCDCISLTAVTLPNGVAGIEESTFRNCKSLTAVTLPDSVTSIGKWVFSGCKSLTSVTFPDSLMSIGESAFYKCESLTSITLPDSVTSIGKDAFFDCKNLTSVVLPANGANIGKDAFFGCKNLTIYGPPSSYAESYAKEHKISFSTKQ